MTSNVTFRKQQGAARSQCFFHGDGIKLIDLKRDILSQEGEKGKSTGSLDFDYEIKDENTNLGKCHRARAPTRRWTKWSSFDFLYVTFLIPPFFPSFPFYFSSLCPR